MPPHVKKSTNHALLEKRTYEEIVSHLEKEFELKGFEAPDELQINTGTQQATQQNPEKPKPTCHHCKKARSLLKAVTSTETKRRLSPK